MELFLDEIDKISGRTDRVEMYLEKEYKGIYYL